jgi:hypothetical protein
MQGDFSRSTFDPRKHFSAVLTQQGRVRLDSDDNEQAAILLRSIRALAADVIGPAGYPEAPDGTSGFRIDVADKDLSITPGRLYVDGILVENDEAETSYFTQPDGYLDQEREPLPESGAYLVYLRVWEQVVTALQDPFIREVALGDLGPDTSARSRVVWQVAHFVPPAESSDPGQAWRNWLDELHSPRGTLTARAGHTDDTDDEPCVLPPSSKYRGESNQLYRVEIHRGGPLGAATFKWSRENASVVFPIISLSGDQVEVGWLGRDGKLGLEVGDLVEIADDASAARMADDPLPDSVPRLRRVVALDPADRLVTLDASTTQDQTGVGTDPRRHPLLRRWDQRAAAQAPEGTIPVAGDDWIHLEDGVNVRFSGERAQFRRGDYWLIPARTVTGDIVWPTGAGGPVAREPDGVDYHYAPLATISDGAVTDLRQRINPVTGQVTGQATIRRSSSRRR